MIIHPSQGLEEGHAEIGPSSASRWLRCPASIRLSREVPPRESGDAARAGTVIHGALERTLRGEIKGLTEDDIDEISNLEFAIDRAAEIYSRAVDIAHHVLAEHDIAELWLEERVWPLPGIVPDLWGTGDIIGLSRDGKRLLVGDLKTGRHMVDVHQNDQLMIYGLGALQMLGERAEKIEQINLCIIQPVDGAKPGFSIYRSDRAEMKQFRDFVVERCSIIESAEPIPTVSGCRFCPASRICPA